MRPEGNPLDLNNLPEDYSRDGKQAPDHQDTSSFSGLRRKKKSGAMDGKEDRDLPPNKVYQCRFCSLKFCKSQALGGHMNRHRQERETETLNKARQLVFTNDMVNPAGHLGYISSGSYNPQSGDGALPPFRPMYPTRLFPTAAPLIPGAAAAAAARTDTTPPPYVLTSPPCVLPFSAPPPAAAAANDYFLGHAIPNSTIPRESNNYTCIGAPVSNGGARRNEEEVQLNWGRR